MKPSPVLLSLLGLVLFGLGVAPGSVAKSNADSPQRVEIQRTDLTGPPPQVLALPTFSASTTGYL